METIDLVFFDRREKELGFEIGKGDAPTPSKERAEQDYYHPIDVEKR